MIDFSYDSIVKKPPYIPHHTLRCYRKPLNLNQKMIQDFIAPGMRENGPVGLGTSITSMNAFRDFWHDLAWDVRCALRDIGVRLSAAFR